MTGQRVFVIWTNPLFHESVRLLLSQSKLELVGASSDHTAAQRQIRELEPDVVIIEETDGEMNASEETVAILRASPKVIRLSLADNELSIYQRQRRTIKKVDDLMNLISQASTQEKGAN
jgi:DNA-binding NarL/FixJ family response regulator